MTNRDNDPRFGDRTLRDMADDPGYGDTGYGDLRRDMSDASEYNRSLNRPMSGVGSESYDLARERGLAGGPPTGNDFARANSYQRGLGGVTPDVTQPQYGGGWRDQAPSDRDRGNEERDPYGRGEEVRGNAAPRGPHYGRGPRGYARSDERIQEDVSERLTYDHDVDASDIEVQVSGGEVTLMGNVADRRQKRLAEDLAEGVRGVRDVHNQLRVRPEGRGGPL